MTGSGRRCQEKDSSNRSKVTSVTSPNKNNNKKSNSIICPSVTVNNVVKVLVNGILSKSLKITIHRSQWLLILLNKVLLD